MKLLIVDCHVHATGSEKVDAIIKAMDAAGIDVIFLFSPYPGSLEDPYLREVKFSAKRQREVAKFIADIQRRAPDRIKGFLWLEPRIKEAPSILEWAISDLELRGIKMIPHHWYPFDEMLFPIYEKVEELRVPILFHSGILFGFADSSRFCRPAHYELLLKFPKIKFALAHISWPWVDECIAVWGRYRAALRHANKDMKEMQMFIDATPGTPPLWRKEALRKVFAYGAEDFVMFGSDSTPSTLNPRGKQVWERDLLILRNELGLPDQTVRKYLGENALRFIGEKG